MNDNLSCALVRDLLPSYLEGLTSEETNEALRGHLETCPACAKTLSAMQDGPEAAEQPLEVDYLKRVKKQNRKRVIISVLATFTGLLAALLLKIFVVGTPLQVQTVAVTDAREDHGRLCLNLSSTVSANAYHGWTVETENGVACVYAREVLVSSLYNSAQAQVYVPLEGVDEVWLGGVSGKLVWQDGIVISRQALDLLEARTPYCGDASALNDIAALLRIPEQLGAFTTTLQTSQYPYRWTLEFSDALNASQSTQMVRCAYLMLALVDNLDEVAYTWPGPDGQLLGGSLFRDSAAQGTRSLTEEYNVLHGTDWMPKSSMKDYTQTPADFQRLLELLELL